MLQMHNGRWFAAPTGLYTRPGRAGSIRCDALADPDSVDLLVLDEWLPGTLASRDADGNLGRLLEGLFDAGDFESSCDAPSFCLSADRP